jgi:hypothetical protein
VLRAFPVQHAVVILEVLEELALLHGVVPTLCPRYLRAAA